MKLRKNNKTLAVVAGLALAAGSANAVSIIVDDTQVANVGGFVGSYTLWTAYDASGSNKLVVTVNMERDRGDPNTNINSVTYGGTPMIEAIKDKGWGEGPVGIWYFDNPGAAGDIVANGSAKMNGSLGSLLALSNTNAGVGATNSTAGSSTSLTLTVSNSLVVAAYMANEGGSPTADSPLTQLLSNNGGNNYFSGASGYENGVSGSTTPTFTPSSAGTSAMTVAAEFTAVPEPSTTALLGLGGLALILRRRK